MPELRTTPALGELRFGPLWGRRRMKGHDCNVVLVLGGHYHKAKVARYRDDNFVQLPSPAPNGSDEVTIIRITSDRLLAVPYQYETKTWSNGRGKVLNIPIRGPAPACGRQS